MPPPVPYTPGRRLIMNIVLWALLAITVVGAALLASAKSGRWQTALQEPAAFGTLEVRLPKGWQVTSSGRRSGTQIIARDPNRQRLLYITTADRGTSPDLSMLDPSIGLALGSGELSRFDEDISIPGGKGKIIHVVDQDENPVVSMAYLVFDSGPAVVVNLRNTGERTPADEALLYEVAKSIRPHAGPPAPHASDPDSFDI